MEELETFTNSLQIIFRDIQRCDSKIFSANLSSIMSKIEESNISEDFVPIIYSILMCKKQQIPSKLVLFLKRIFEESKDTETGRLFVNDIFNVVLGLLDSKITKVRRNAIFLLKVISTIEDLEHLVNETLLEKVSEKLFDKEKTVRKEALLFLIDHQNNMVHGSTLILNLFKNLCRFDPSNEVRKVAFQNLQVTKQTYKCIIERCIDVNLSIRLVFFKKYLNKIAIRDLDHSLKCFLFKRAYSERDFSAIEYFITAIQEYYDLPSEFANLIEDFYSDRYENVFRKFIFRLLDLYEFEYLFDEIQKNETLPSYYLFYYYLSYIEENKGRDELSLPNLTDFTEFLYMKSKDNDDSNRIEKSSILFKILRMYDVFDDSSRKIISNIVHRILKGILNEDIINESIGLMYSIDPILSDKVFGSLIYKNIASNLDFSMIIASNVMRNSKEIKEIQKAIIKEIVMPNFSHNISPIILFYYLSLELDNDLLNYLIQGKETNNNYLSMLVDLTLIYKIDEMLSLTLDVVKEKISSESEESIVPISKLILGELSIDKSIINKYISYSMKIYYTTANDKTQQYLDLFYHKHFSSEPLSLINVFFFVYESLELNHKIFIDQTLYWLENSNTRDALQKLYYNICLNMFIYQPNLKNVKAFIGILNKIQIDERWICSTTKKIIFCCSQLLKTKENKKFMSEIVNKLLSIDDGEPISPEDLLDVKTDLLMS